VKVPDTWQKVTSPNTPSGKIAYVISKEEYQKGKSIKKDEHVFHPEVHHSNKNVQNVLPGMINPQFIDNGLGYQMNNGFGYPFSPAVVPFYYPGP